jgi:uncharacterized membrane protein
MGFMMLWMLLPVALVVGAVWRMGAGVAGRERQGRGDEASALLRQRLAAGEIDVEQYEQARAALGLPPARDGLRDDTRHPGSGAA